MKNYENPTIETLEFEMVDIVTDSKKPVGPDIETPIIE